MDKIWDRKSFEVVGHWPLTTQNRQKSNAKKNNINIAKCFFPNSYNGCALEEQTRNVFIKLLRCVHV